MALIGTLESFKELRRGSQRERQKGNRFILAKPENNSSANASRFLNTARLRRENGQFHVLLEEANTRQRTELRYSLKIQLQKKMATFDELNEEAARIHFLSYVFVVVVAGVLAWAPSQDPTTATATKRQKKQ